jgi:hypothetical protein
MKRAPLTSSLVLAALALTFSGQPVLAQGSLNDLGKGLMKGAEGSSGAAGIANLPGSLSLDKIIAALKEQGYSNIKDLKPSASGKTLQAKATNSGGSLVDLLINPSTGKVLSEIKK